MNEQRPEPAGSGLRTASDSLTSAIARSEQRFLTLLLDLVFVYALAFALGVFLSLAGAGDLVLSAPPLLLGLIVQLFYYIPQEALWGRTLGKRIVGTRVVREDGGPLTFGQTVGRTLCRCIPFEAFSFLSGDGRPRGWHDTIPKTKVISLKESVVAGAVAEDGPAADSVTAIEAAAACPDCRTAVRLSLVSRIDRQTGKAITIGSLIGGIALIVFGIFLIGLGLRLVAVGIVCVVSGSGLIGQYARKCIRPLTSYACPSCGRRWKRLGGDDAADLQPLITALTDGRAKVRREALEALGRVEDPRAVSAMLETLNDTDRNVRVAAAAALRKFREPAVVDRLTEAQSDPSPGVRLQAKASLKAIMDAEANAPAAAVSVPQTVPAFPSVPVSPAPPVSLPVETSPTPPAAPAAPEPSQVEARPPSPPPLAAPAEPILSSSVRPSVPPPSDPASSRRATSSPSPLAEKPLPSPIAPPESLPTAFPPSTPFSAAIPSTSTAAERQSIPAASPPQATPSNDALRPAVSFPLAAPAAASRDDEGPPMSEKPPASNPPFPPPPVRPGPRPQDKPAYGEDVPGRSGPPSRQSAQQTQTFVSGPRFGLPRGTRFAGRYQVIEEIGQGGMGKVYRVEDTQLKEDVALKFLRPDISADDSTVTRFRDELKLSRRISHKNVCRMYHFGEFEGHLFLTMEYVSGEDLSCTIRRAGPLSPAKAVLIAGQICDGLAEAHRLGVVHRDLKPRNIMLDKSGDVRIMDFGIARALNTRGATTAGALVGTPEYMAPEQAQGHRVDHRADIYAMGVILYEMVTGSVPFQGDTAISTTWKLVHEPPRRPETLNDQVMPDLSRIILTCLAKKPEQRYQNVRDLAADLRSLQGALPLTDRILPDKRSSMERVRTMLRSRKTRLSTAAAAVPALAAAVWLLVLRPGADDRPTAPAVLPDTAPAATPASPAADPLAAGRAAFDRKDYDDALASFRLAAAVEPQAYEAQLGIGDVLQNQGRGAEAVEAYEKAVALDRLDPRAYRRLGGLFEDDEKWEIAEYYYRRFLQAAADSPEREAFEAGLRALTRRSRAEAADRTPAETPAPVPTLTSLVQRGKAAFDDGDHAACIAWMASVLERSPAHEEALDYTRRAREALLRPQVEVLIGGYETAMRNASLPSFYERNCLPECGPLLRAEAETICRDYKELECFVSDLRVRLPEADRAVAEFSHIITGVLRTGGAKAVLFEGTMAWELVRRDGAWKIAEVSARPADGLRPDRPDPRPPIAAPLPRPEQYGGRAGPSIPSSPTARQEVK